MPNTWLDRARRPTIETGQGLRSGYCPLAQRASGRDTHSPTEKINLINFLEELKEKTGVKGLKSGLTVTN